MRFYKQQMHSDTPEMNLITDYVYSLQGKHLRPLLALLSAALNGGINARSRAGAAIVELAHVATLLHDDVLDEAQERRGRTSVNAKWNSKIAVMTGDFLFSRASRLIIEESAESDARPLLQIFTSAMSDICEGEMMQMQRTQDLDVNEDVYFEIIGKKTASLLRASTHIGAVSAGADGERLEAAKAFGMALGIAFQIRDDILDYHDPQQTGKHSGSDIRERKLTLPLIFALRQADKPSRRRILEMVTSAREKPANVQAVMDFVRQQGGLEYAQQQTMQYAQQAKDALGIYPRSAVRDALLALTDYVALRNK